MKSGTSSQDLSIFSLGEPLANPSQSQGCDKDSKTQGETSALHILQSLLVLGLDGSFGKMYREFSVHPEDGISLPSSARWGTWAMGGPTACWTLSGSEHNSTHAPSRSAEGVSSLSDVLETQPLPQRYCLSSKACLGILKRAERRGKKLPEMLRQALEAVAGGTVEMQTTP